MGSVCRREWIISSTTPTDGVGDCRQLIVVGSLAVDAEMFTGIEFEGCCRLCSCRREVILKIQLFPDFFTLP